MRYFVRPTRSVAVAWANPTEEQVEQLRKWGFTEVDESAYEAHRRAWPAEDLRPAREAL